MSNAESEAMLTMEESKDTTDNDEPLITIITPTLRQPASLHRMIAAFDANPPKHDHIIWDNSPDNAHSSFERTSKPVVRVYSDHGQNVPFGRANNLAAREARGKWLLFANDDMEPTPTLLEEMLKLTAYPMVGIVGARLLYPNGLVQHGGVGFDGRYNPLHLWRFAPQSCKEVTVTRPVPVVTGACMMISNTLFDTIQGFDTNLQWAYEDVDLCLRVRDAGYAVAYCADAVATHYEGLTRGGGRTPQANVIEANNWVYFCRKWLDTGRFFAVMGLWPISMEGSA